MTAERTGEDGAMSDAGVWYPPAWLKALAVILLTVLGIATVAVGERGDAYVAGLAILSQLPTREPRR